MRGLLLFIGFFTATLVHGQWFAPESSDSTGVDLDIGNNSDYEGYDVLDSLAAKHRLIIVGEDYDFEAFNSKVEFKMLRYLNHSQGLRHYLIETSPARAELINEYVYNGDSAVEDLLKSVSKVKYMRLYKNLRRLNATLPDSLKITVHGIDVERNYMLPLIRISQVLPDNNIPDRLRISTEAVKGAAKYLISKGLHEYERDLNNSSEEDDGYSYTTSAFSVRQSVSEFMRQYDSLAADYKAWLGDSFYRFENALNWLKEYNQYNRYQRTAMEYTWRDEVMYQRLNTLLKEFPEEKFFGQFGLCRVGAAPVDKECGINMFRGLVYKLKKTPSSAGKDVASIGIFYKEELDYVSSYRDVQHGLYAETLDKLFADMPLNEARFAQRDKDSAAALFRDFNMVLLNNRYEIEDGEDDDIYDSTVGEAPSWYDESRKSRVFIGAHWFQPYVKLTDINRQLKINSLDTVKQFAYAGGEFVVASENSTGGFYFHQLVSENKAFSGWSTGLKAGSCFLYKRFIKWSMMSTLGYGQLRYTKFSASNTATYFADYQKPEVYKNSTLIYALSTDLWLDFSPFYIYAAGGYQGDISSKTWRLNGIPTGAQGSFSAKGLFYNLGAGISIPLRYFE